MSDAPAQMQNGVVDQTPTSTSPASTDGGRLAAAPHLKLPSLASDGSTASISDDDLALKESEPPQTLLPEPVRIMTAPVKRDEGVVFKAQVIPPTTPPSREAAWAAKNQMPKMTSMFSFSTVDKMTENPTVAALGDTRPPAASLEIETIQPDQAFLNQEATFRFNVQNTGDAVAKNVLLSVTAKTKAAIVRGNPRPIHQDGRQADFAVGDLKAGASTTVELTVIPQNAGAVTLECRATSQVVDRTEVPVEVAGVRLSITGPDSASANQVFFQVIQVCNVSGVPLKSLKVKQFCGSSGQSDGDQVVTLAELPPGQSCTIRFAARYTHPGPLEMRYVAENDLVNEAVRDIVHIGEADTQTTR